MEYLIYLLLPFIWLFLLLEWIYNKICNFVYWILGERDAGNRQRKRATKKAQGETMNGKAQGETSQREKRPVTDDGMDPQERLIPYITQEPKQTPVKEKPPKFVFEKPKRHTLKTRDKKQDKERRGMER